MAATAGNFGPPIVLVESNSGGLKKRVVSALGPAAYATNGSELDLSADVTDGMGTTYDAFAVVYAVAQVGVSPHASDKYRTMYVPAASGAPGTGLVKVRDLSAAADAEVTAAVDLSATTFYFEVTGR